MAQKSATERWMITISCRNSETFSYEVRVFPAEILGHNLLTGQGLGAKSFQFCLLPLALGLVPSFWFRLVRVKVQ